MRKAILFFVCSIFSLGAWCQLFTSLNQNFDVSCASGGGIAYFWHLATPTTATIPQGEWTCNSFSGRGTTPAIQCSGTYSSAFHLDTSYLLTPQLYLASYTGHIYLQFDVKTSNLNASGHLAVQIVTDTTHPGTGAIDITPGLNPLFSSADSVGWVTHVADLTPYKTLPFYVAFRYVSTVTTGSIWYLDNVNTTVTPITLGVAIQNEETVQLSVSNSCTRSCVGFSYAVTSAGDYTISLVDLLGREVYHQQLALQGSQPDYRISGLDLNAGLYFLKVGNGLMFGATRIMIP
jgi:hypothetical protein